VQIEIDIVRQNAQAQLVFAQDGQRRERANVLANGQRRDADEIDELRQGALPDSSVEE
jgi:hypothetical protein